MTITTEKKKLPTTIQTIMSDREIFLLETLRKQIGITKTKVLLECVNRVIDKYKHLLEEDE